MPLRPRPIVLALLVALVLSSLGVGHFPSGVARGFTGEATSGAGVLAATDGAVPVRCPAGPGDTIESSYDGRDSAPPLANRSVVETYTAGRLGEFGGYLFTAGPPSKLRVAFAGHVPDHLDALRALVPFPDRLDVVQADHSVVELGKIMESLAVESARPDRAGVFVSLSVGWQAVDVGMNAGLEELAARYAERFGSGVRITLGGHAYLPAGCGPRVAPPLCPDLVGGDPKELRLTLAVVADTPTITAAQTGKARLVVHNLGARRFAIDTGGPIVGSLVLPGTRSVVGRWSGVLAGVGGGVDLTPGKAGAIDVFFGASRCDGQPGSALPPGRYGLRVVLAPGRAGEPRLLSGETFITVATNPPQPV